MKRNWTSFWYITGRKAISRSRRGWWTGITEVSIASSLVLFGVVLLVGFLTVNWLSPSPDEFFPWLLDYIVKPMLSIAMIGLGGFMMINAIWSVSGSAERRGALVSKANQVDLLNEIWRRRGDLPNVPSKMNSPQKGQELDYRIIASRQSLWGLLTAGILWLMFVVIVAVLVVSAYVKMKMGRADWVAGGVAIPTAFAAVWSFSPIH